MNKYHEEVAKYAQEVKERSRNGFAKNHRVLAEIPLDLYSAIEKSLQARDQDSSPDGVLKEIQKNFPYFLTVNAVDTGSKGQIRVN